MPEPAIEARGLSYQYATRAEPAFTGVDLRIERGERVILTGDSGSGKSTLLAVLAGLAGDEEDGHATGHLTVNGTVGMVMQDPEAQTILTRVGDDVAFGAENLGVPREEIWPRVERALDAVGLDVPLEHNTAHLSGGQKQRLALAGVLAMGADILILDEPTANLDPAGRDEVIAAVEQVCERSETTLIVVEHRPRHWAHLATRAYRLGADGVDEVGVEKLPGAPQLPPARGVRADASALATRGVRTRVGLTRDLRIPLGASTVITGANGVGKTTLAHVLAGLDAPRAGEVVYAESIRRGLDTPAITWKSAQLAERIGFVFQEPEHQFVTSTVREEMALSGAPQARVDELLARLRLDHLVGANPFTLSGGEKRRLSVATALVNAPRLVLFDEPTFGQDDRTFVELAALIRELTDEGVTVVSITHDEAFIASLGDHIIHLEAAQ